MRFHYRQEQKISVFSEACFPGSTQFPIHWLRGGGVFIAHIIFFCQSVNWFLKKGCQELFVLTKTRNFREGELLNSSIYRSLNTFIVAI